MLEVIVGVLGTAMVGAIAAVINLFSRVNVQEQRHNDLITLFNSKLDGLGDKIDIKFDDVDRRLTRIEKSYNGHLFKD